METHPSVNQELALNIFHLHPNPEVCAEHYVDIHLGKILIECAQMLSTAVRLTPGAGDEFHLNSFYQATHINHPMNVWVRSSYSNWYWTILHAMALSKEYTYRLLKIHGAHGNGLNPLLDDDVNIFMHRNLPYAPTPFPLCIPDHYKFYDDPHWAYRAYYKFGKSHVHKWTKRGPPEWMDQIPRWEELCPAR